MEIEDILEGGMVFNDRAPKAFAHAYKPPKKKLSGPQKMKADYKAQKAFESRKRAEKQAEKRAKR